MSSAPIRREFRVALSDVERSLAEHATLIVGQQVEESAEHLVLRVLAWCLLWEPTLELAPGVLSPDDADLYARDLTGRVITWVECGATSAEKLRRVVRHQRGARVHVVGCDDDARAQLLAELRRGKRTEGVELHLIARELVERLAALEPRRQNWSVTLVGGHAYVEADGLAADGAIDRVVS